MKKRKTLSKREKEIYNAGVKSAVNEAYLYDGLIPEERDRQYMKEKIFKKCAYVLKKKV